MFRIFCIVVSVGVFFLSSFDAATADEYVSLEGTIRGLSGDAVAGASVTIEQLSLRTSTDESGNFQIRLRPGTYDVVVEAEGFQIYGERIKVGPSTLMQIEIALPRRLLQFEEIVFAPEESSGSSISTPVSSVQPARQSSPASILEAVKDIPSVAPMGQGGLFQVPSVRGAARDRTILLLDSIRMTSERRTGPSFSLVDPLLLDRVNVTRGPAPVLFGSNGETGLIQAFAAEPSGTRLSAEFRTGYQSNSNENWQALTVRNGTDRFQYVVGVARREASSFEAGDGQEFSAGFNRLNLLAKGRWFTEAGTLSFLVLPSWTDDIEKASSDAQTRPTLYPEERHQIYMVDWQNALLSGGLDFQIQGWLHPSSLITQDERVADGVVTSRNLVYNDSDDFGTRIRVGKQTFGDWRLWAGFDLFGRTNIKARQESFLPAESGAGFDLDSAFYSIRDGRYLDTGLFLTGNGNVGALIASAGVRVQRVATANRAGSSVSDSEYSWSGNFGADLPLAGGWEAVLNLGRGVRPATISEKFFTGETGRGSITGNPDLVTESNLEVDGGIRFRREHMFAGLYAFRNSMTDYIARIRLADGSYTYANLSRVRVHGFEGEGWYRWKRLQLYGNFHRMQGEESNGTDVNDIPPSRLLTGIEYGAGDGRWIVSFEFVRQFRKIDPGPDELARDAASVINIKSTVQLNGNLALRFAVSNLSDAAYFDSADNRAPLAIGRTVSFEFLMRY